MFKLSVCANMENVVELKLVDLLTYVLGEFTGVLPCKCTKSIWAKIQLLERSHLLYV